MSFLTSLDGYGSQQELCKQVFGADGVPANAADALLRVKGLVDHPFINPESLYFRVVSPSESYMSHGEALQLPVHCAGHCGGLPTPEPPKGAL